jgi:hypothetical protein
MNDHHRWVPGPISSGHAQESAMAAAKKSATKPATPTVEAVKVDAPKGHTPITEESKWFPHYGVRFNHVNRRYRVAGSEASPVIHSMKTPVTKIAQPDGPLLAAAKAMLKSLTQEAAKATVEVAERMAAAEKARAPKS